MATRVAAPDGRAHNLIDVAAVNQRQRADDRSEGQDEERPVAQRKGQSGGDQAGKRKMVLDHRETSLSSTCTPYVAPARPDTA